MSHHLGNHVLRPLFSRSSRQLAEREADYHTGFVLGRMSATYGKTTDVIRWLPGKDADYPTREQRLCELGRGWRDAQKLIDLFATDPEKKAGPVLCDGKAPDPARFSLRANHDIYGHDILFDGKAYVEGLDLAACSMLCDNNPNCKGFSFDRWRGLCYLKDEIAHSIIDPPSVIGAKLPVGLLPPNPDRKTIMHSTGNKRFHDSPIDAPSAASSARDCQAQCKNNERCFVYTFFVGQNSCLMYDTTEGPYYDETALSGFKQQEPIKPKG